MKKPPLVDFRPFRAWRYHPERVELSQAIAPPYDVISPPEQDALYAKSPFNVVRLILGKEADFYEEASRRWEEWTQKGILVQDRRPAFYLYEQAFSHPASSTSLRRLAFVGILKLDPTESVLRHEATFAGPKEDRFRLLEKTKTNLSPLFGLYRNSKKSLSRIFASSCAAPPLFDVRDDRGVLHQGWAIEKKSDQEAIRMALAREKILIADGHHRYETALKYRRQMRMRFPDAPAHAPFDFAMMALVEFEDEGLLVLPTHRLIHSFGTFSKKAFLEGLRSYFDFIPSAQEELFTKLEARPANEKVFGGLFGDAGNFLLKLKALEAIRSFLPVGRSQLWYEMEANLLTYFIFGSLWKIPSEEQKSLIEYTHSGEEAARVVREGKAEAALLMRAPRVETIRELAQAGEKMPQKTTYFYPKLASGLFFYHHG